jgi:hypothetical protein
LSSPSNATLGSAALTTVNIVDNDKRKGGPIRGSTTLQNKTRMMDISRNRLRDLGSPSVRLHGRPAVDHDLNC